MSQWQRKLQRLHAVEQRVRERPRTRPSIALCVNNNNCILVAPEPSLSPKEIEVRSTRLDSQTLGDAGKFEASAVLCALASLGRENSSCCSWKLQSTAVGRKPHTSKRRQRQAKDRILVTASLRTRVDADAVILKPICPNHMLKYLPLFYRQHSIMYTMQELC